jgi:ankyrin repeat protein
MWGAQINVDLKEDILLSRNHERQTAGHLAALRGNHNIQDKILTWGKEQQMDVMDEIFLSEDLSGSTPWRLATNHGAREIVGSKFLVKETWSNSDVYCIHVCKYTVVR